MGGVLQVVNAIRNKAAWEAANQTGPQRNEMRPRPRISMYRRNHLCITELTNNTSGNLIIPALISALDGRLRQHSRCHEYGLILLGNRRG